MMRKMIRGVVVGAVMTVVGLVATGESRGFFNYLQKRYNAAAAMYGGTTCNPCAQQMTVNYVPQTCYRVQYCSVPQTTYRPFTSCDPCTGCQTTCMRPVTQYVQQAQYVPYTTYRLQYSVSQPACPTPTTSYYAAPSGCSSCGTGIAAAAYYAPAPAYPATTNYAPTTSYAAPAVSAPSGCSSCGLRPATTSYYAPGATYAAPTTQYSLSGPNATLAPTYTNAPPTGATTYNYAPSSSTPSYSGPTYANPSNNYNYYVAPASPPPATVVSPTPTNAIVSPSTPSPTIVQSPITTTGATPTPAAAPQTELKSIAPHETMKPIPDPLSTEPEKPVGPKLNPMSTPRLFDLHDKTAAAWPVERAWGYTAVGAVTAARPAATPVVHATVEPSPVTLGAPIVTQPAPSSNWTPVQPKTDVNGWRAIAR